MTRLQGLMPYDLDQGAEGEFRLLLAELIDAFLERLEAAKEGSAHKLELAAFARYCLQNSITCITFNYDDLLDQALWEVKPTPYPTKEPYWHPDGGYGLFCRPSALAVRDMSVFMDRPSTLLLKLHGSVNWRPRRGHRVPYSVDAIHHHETWFRVEADDHDMAVASPEAIALHLEPEPLIVPPVLVKPELVEQPVLRVIWHNAYQALLRAHHVVFIGYSFPTTDIAVRTLFDEGLHDFPQADIRIVNPGN
jgi:hypothetical protein